MTGTQQLAELLRQSDKIVFFGGAGVSTESGIPDFRSENGSFQALKQYGRPPEELLSHSFFELRPEVFFSYHKNTIVSRTARPNAAHMALARLEKQGKLIAVVTQNIDGLHQLAGSRNVLELHGSLLRNYCVNCGSQYDLDYIFAPEHCEKNGQTGEIPYCGKCGGIVRPDVVLYEESLDNAVLQKSTEAIERADLLLVGGTSLVVYPAAGLLRFFRGKHLVLINRSETSYDNKASLVIRDFIGEVLGAAVETALGETR